MGSAMSVLIPRIGGSIGGRWVGTASEETFDVIDPATGEVLAAAPDMGAAETAEAVEAAARSLDRSATPEARRAWRLALELGGNAPFIVFEDADVEAAAEALIANKFRAGGQTCVCANRIHVHEAIEGPFVEAVAARVRRLRFGHVGVNTGTGPTPEAPFGGVKESGFGREGGIEGLLELCEPQTVAEAIPGG